MKKKYVPFFVDSLDDAVVSTYVDSIASLRVIDYDTNNAPSSCIVRYHTSSGDGGGGTFVWDAAETAADDDGIYILPTGHVGAGRWVRQVTGDHINVRWYGAQGTGLVDDQPAIQAALDAIAIVGIGSVYVPLGVYRLDSGLSLNHPELILYGDGSGQDNGTVSAPESTLSLITGSTFLKNFNGDALTLQSGNAILLVEGIKVDVSSTAYATDTGHGIVVNSGRIECRNVKSNHHGGCGYYVTDNVSASCNYWKLTNCHASFNRDSGLKIYGPNNNTNAGVAYGFHTRNNNWGIWINQASNNKFFGMGLQSDILGGVYIEGDAVVKSNGNVLCYSYIEPQTTSHVVIADANCLKNIIIGGQGGSLIGHSVTDNGTSTLILGSKNYEPWINKLWLEEIHYQGPTYTGNFSLEHPANREFNLIVDGTSGSGIMRLGHNEHDVAKFTAQIEGVLEVLGAYAKSAEYRADDGVNNGRLVLRQSGVRSYEISGEGSSAAHVITFRSFSNLVADLSVVVNGSLTIPSGGIAESEIFECPQIATPSGSSGNARYFGKVDDNGDTKPFAVWSDGTEVAVGSRISDTLQTVDTTLTTISNIPTQTDKCTWVEATIQGRDSTSGDTNFYKLSGFFANAAGTVTQKGTTTTLDSHEDDATWNCIFAISGTSVIIRVVGDASNTVEWSCVGNYNTHG